MKPGISKKTFCKALALIQEQEQINEQFGEALNLVGDGFFLFGAENRNLEALLLVLKEAMNDQYDYIDWWLYEASDYRVWSGDGNQVWELKEPEALYDFIISECQDP